MAEKETQKHVQGDGKKKPLGKMMQGDLAPE